MLRNTASGPEIGLPGRISAGFWSQGTTYTHVFAWQSWFNPIPASCRLVSPGPGAARRTCPGLGRANRAPKTFKDPARYLRLRAGFYDFEPMSARFRAGLGPDFEADSGRKVLYTLMCLPVCPSCPGLPRSLRLAGWFRLALVSHDALALVSAELKVPRKLLRIRPDIFDFEPDFG